MGSGASKQAGKAAAAVGRRQYPSTSSILNQATSTSSAPGVSVKPNVPNEASQVHPDPTTSPPSDTRDEHIDLDARDPQFGDALKRLGPAISVERAAPGQGSFPTSSQPPLGQQGKNIFPAGDPKSNPSLMIVKARERINQQYDVEADEVGRSSAGGRTLVSAKDIKEALKMRDQGGMSSEEIEKQLRLKSGILKRLGKPGVFANV